MLLTDIQPGQELTDAEWLAVEIPLPPGVPHRLRMAALERALIEQTYRQEHGLLDWAAMRGQLQSTQHAAQALADQLTALLALFPPTEGGAP